jgi:hypothetical protein
MKTFVLSTIAMGVLAAGASAQQVSTYTFERKASADQSSQVLLDKIKMEQGQIAVMSKTVPNAPYSAEATSESVQVLQDGNRIVKRTVTRIYRDSAGRTRKEILDGDGQLTSVFITDPTTGTNTVFDPRGNTVGSSVVTLRKAPGEAGTVVASGGSEAVWVTSADKQKIEIVAGQSIPRERVAVGGVVGGAGGSTITYAPSAAAKGETTKEDLGQQNIEGVAAAGTRTTTLIPAGAIGNEQPIRIVSEEWFSPDLQVLVLTKHSDPRTGETTYRLTGINRTEPARSLFDPPVGR